MSEDLAKFVAELHAEALDRAGGADGTGADFKENAFTELVLEHLEGLGVIENSACVFFEGRAGRGTGKVNGYAVPDDEGALDLFVSAYLGAAEPTRIPAEEVRRAVEQAVRYFDAALKGLHASLQPGTEVMGMTRRIHELGTRLSLVRVFVLSDGVTGLGRDRLPDRTLGPVQLRFEVWDAERLSRVLASGRPHEVIDIDVAEFHAEPVPCIRLPDVVEEYTAYVTILPGPLVYSIYDRFKARLLERNVRSFLQAKGKVNRGIRDTLRREPARFMAYNNGISITADSVETETRADGTLCLRRIRGLQIVNGGQTTASIHRAAKEDKADLSKVFLQAKITVVPSELLDKLAKSIAEFANTQNPVQMADFSANDPFHVTIERLSKSVWIPGEQGKWFYERARGQYQVAQALEGNQKRFKEQTPSTRRFAKTDLAKFLNIWDQLPQAVAEGAQKNFVLFTQRLRETRPKNWQPDETFYRELIAKGILFNVATTIVREERFEGYKPQIVAYTLAYLSFRSAGMFDLAHVWQHQRPSMALERLLRDWSHPIAARLIQSAGSKDVKEWMKKADCWKDVRALDLPWPEKMPPELQQTVRTGGGWGVNPAQARVALDADEVDAISACRRIDAPDWIRIVDWGRNTGRIDQQQRNVAVRLASLAANGWPTDPAPRDAKEGRRMLNAALESSVLGAEDTSAKLPVSTS